MPRSRRNEAGSNDSPGGGVTASRTRGSARDARAWRTPSQIESRVRGSEWAACSRASPQPGAALDQPSTAMASAAEAGSRDQRYRSWAVRPSRAAACSSARRTASVWACQKSPPSTVRLMPVPAASPRARIMAVCGSSQPRTGDQRRPRETPAANCCGSKTATGPTACRACMVTARLSGRVLVDTTAPGASSSIGITRCSPLPERGGPTTSIESSTEAHTCRPRERPSR